jgi:heterodisulfide reductase subunit C
VSDGVLNELLQDCTRCGLCREVCIVERLGGHSITSFLCGETDYSSWLCSSCWRCQEVCPQGVDIHAIMMLKRREEEPPMGHETNLVNVMGLGYSLNLDDHVNELRRFHGLDAVQLIPAGWVEILLQGDMAGNQEGS